MKMSNEEKRLLSKLESGELDGCVGDSVITNGGSSVWKVITNGLPTMLKEGPGGKFFNGKENERIDGVRHIYEKWDTDDRKIEFLRKFGWLMDDADVKAYSAKFKPKK